MMSIACGTSDQQVVALAALKKVSE
jgi:hypothetical protein